MPLTPEQLFKSIQRGDEVPPRYAKLARPYDEADVIDVQALKNDPSALPDPVENQAKQSAPTTTNRAAGSGGPSLLLIVGIVLAVIMVWR